MPPERTGMRPRSQVAMSAGSAHLVRQTAFLSGPMRPGLDGKLKFAIQRPGSPSGLSVEEVR